MTYKASILSRPVRGAEAALERDPVPARPPGGVAVGHAWIRARLVPGAPVGPVDPDLLEDRLILFSVPVQRVDDPSDRSATRRSSLV
jgi:hypothetical protein